MSLIFAAVHCDPISTSSPLLTMRVDGTRLGQTAVFQCPVGYRVNGTSNLTCQASGMSRALAFKWKKVLNKL